MKKQMLVLVFALSYGVAFAEEAESIASLEAPQVATVPRPRSTAGATADLGDDTTGQTVTAVKPKSDAKIYAMLELRPSVSTKSGVLGSENTFEGGYQFNSTTRLTYAQWWNTSKNLSEGLYTHDGFFRMRAYRVMQDGNFSLDYQGRLYVPTLASRRDAGFIAGLYTGLTANYKLSSTYTLSIAAAPTFNHYTRAAFNGKVSTGFQNTTMVNLDVQITNKLLFSFPLYLITTKANGAPGIAGSNAWSHMVVIWPELDYNLNDNHMIGLAYYSDNLMTSTLGGFNLANGISNGVLQAFWNIRI